MVARFDEVLTQKASKVGLAEELKYLENKVDSKLK